MEGDYGEPQVAVDWGSLLSPRRTVHPRQEHLATCWARAVFPDNSSFAWITHCGSSSRVERAPYRSCPVPIGRPIPLIPYFFMNRRIVVWLTLKCAAISVVGVPERTSLRTFEMSSIVM